MQLLICWADALQSPAMKETLQRGQLSKNSLFPAVHWSYTRQEAILYALSLGCTSEQLQFSYEHAPGFCALPTLAVLAVHKAPVPMAQLLSSFDRSGSKSSKGAHKGRSMSLDMRLLHGEHYLALHRPLPPAGTFTVRPSLIDIIDKGKAAVIITRADIVDDSTNTVIASNDVVSFVRGAGGFGPAQPAQRPAAATAAHKPPERPADAVIEEKTSKDLAALYRLNADDNPLHIDPGLASQAGFPRPILHGLCTMGISTRHIMQHFGGGRPESIKSVKVRFASHVFPGETLQTECWLEGQRIVFQTRVKERSALVMTHAAVELCVAADQSSKPAVRL